MKTVLAIDLGASSGRAILGRLESNGDKIITLQEIHRFENRAIQLNGTLYWDALAIFGEIKKSLQLCHNLSIDSISVDTWGVDFGLIDCYGDLLQNPVCYRDSRTEGMIDSVCQIIPEDTLYQKTGIQFMALNTLFQLYYLSTKRPELLKNSVKLLLMPDLFNYFLSGKMAWEFSIATTTQMLDHATMTWQKEVLDDLAIDTNLLGEICPSGTILGNLRPAIAQEIGQDLNVIAGAGHDTACAVIAVPTENKDFLFISMGTWALVGSELDAPIINDMSKRYNLTNEGGYGDKIHFLKNITGLWLIQETRHHYQTLGDDYTFDEIVEMAMSAEPHCAFIDPNAVEFLSPGDLPKRIAEFCKKTNQTVPQTAAQTFRIIYESLAFKCRQSVEQIAECTGKTYDAIHIIGGGTKAEILCQMIANATAKKVVAGPVEASALGNIAIQMMASGAIKDIAEARQIIKRSTEPKTYYPTDTSAWQDAYQQYLSILQEEAI